MEAPRDPGRCRRRDPLDRGDLSRSSAGPTSAPASGTWSPATRRRASGRRALIQRSLTPVWEANHVWLIFLLVVLWTAFPRRGLGAVRSRPSTCAGAGRGRDRPRGRPLRLPPVDRVAAGSTGDRRAFAVSSVPDPVLHRHVVGTVAAGNVPAEGNGDAFSSWIGRCRCWSAPCSSPAAPTWRPSPDRRREPRRAERGGSHGRRGQGPRALLRPPHPGRRGGRRAIGGARDLRPPRRSPLPLRPPHRPGACRWWSHRRSAGSASWSCSCAGLRGQALRRLGRRGRRRDLGLRRRAVPLFAADLSEDRPESAAPGPTSTRCSYVYAIAVVVDLPALGLLYWSAARAARGLSGRR